MVSLTRPLAGSVMEHPLVPGTVLDVGDVEMKNIAFTYAVCIGNVLYLYIAWHIGDT